MLCSWIGRFGQQFTDALVADVVFEPAARGQAGRVVFAEEIVEGGADKIADTQGALVTTRAG
jgi:hypothetical protein